MSWAAFNLVAQRDGARLASHLAETHLVRSVDTAGIDDGGDLRARFGEALGFEADGWDSFADDVWNHVLPDDDDDDRPVALLWEHADALVAPALDDFLTAFDVLLGVVRAAHEREIDVTLFLLGDGPSFRPLG